MEKSVLSKACYDCKYCKDFGNTHIKVPVCFYAAYNGRPRGCSIEGCTKYEKADTAIEQTHTQES